MVNSSKKSLRQSPSRPKDGKGRSLKSGTAENGESLLGFGNLTTAEDQRSRHQSTGGGYILVPCGFGYKAYLESRQVKLVVLAVSLYIFAAFVASEWIYLLSASFAVALFLGFLLPVIVLASIESAFSLPSEVSPLEPTNIDVRLSKRKILGIFSRFISVASLRMTIKMLKRGASGSPSANVFRPEPVFIENLEQEEWFRFPSPSLKRGVYFIESVEVTTCYPLGIVFWSRTIKLDPKKELKDAMVTVYPSALPITGNFLLRLTGVVSPMGQASANSVITHQSSSFRSVREFRSGDSLRHIHWASSARQNKLLVREFDSEMLPVFDVMLNLRANYRTAEQFELAVTIVNSLVHLGYSLGHMPRLLLYPAVESAEVQALMTDLPQMPPGLGLVAEILARVEPITRIAASKTTFEAVTQEDFQKKWDEVSLKPILTLLPSGEKIIKFSPGKGDVVCLPIDLLEITPDWQKAEAAGWDGGQKDDEMSASGVHSLRGSPKPKKVDKLDIGPTAGDIVARIEWEGDLEGL
jgi:uncharacterized protein (DUF58 family)